MVINTTAALNATLSHADLTISRFSDLVLAPYYHSSLLWIAIPLVISLLIMDFYFGRYKKEELGWNTAVGNSLALIFVTMDLIRQLYSGAEGASFFNLVSSNLRGFLVVFVLGLGSLWLLVAEFFHILPRRLAFFISSTLPTAVFSYTAIVLIYTDIVLDRYTLFAAIALFIILLLLLELIQFLIPAYTEKGPVQQLFSKKD